MVAGTLRSVEPIDIEEPISNQESNSIEQTTLLVSFDGVMYLNGELIPDGHLRSRLESSEWNANQIASSLAVKVDKDMTMLAFSEVVERLRAAGVRRVSMITANSSVSN